MYFPGLPAPTPPQFGPAPLAALHRQCVPEAPACGTTNNLQSSSHRQHRRLGSGQWSPCRDIPGIFDLRSPAKRPKLIKKSSASCFSNVIFRSLSIALLFFSQDVHQMVQNKPLCVCPVVHRLKRPGLPCISRTDRPSCSPAAVGSRFLAGSLYHFQFCHNSPLLVMFLA